jgi:TetR/AcrR family transcriptional regulator
MKKEREAQAQSMPRREQILAAALEEFSHKGFHGASTLAIAEAAGSSHPGLFRTFPTKKRLFLAVLEHTFATIEREMLLRGEEAEGDQLWAMANGWGVLMESREVMLILLQGYAACEDPDIRDLMHGWTRDVFERAEALPGVDADLAHDFFAAGMLYLVAASMDLPGRTGDDPWAERFLASGS